MATINKNDIDLNCTLVPIKFILKGFKQEIIVHTTATEIMDFTDWMNSNPVLKSYSRSERNKFENKYYHFDDYVKKETISINLQEIKTFSMPFFMEANDKEYDVKVMYCKGL